MNEGIDVVVVNYHTPDDLRKFLLSFRNVSDELSTKLYIANNDPLPRDVEVAESSDGVVCNQDNLYYSGALNRQGWLGAHDVVAFFNADTELRPGVLSHCYDLLLSDPQIAVVGPMQVNQRGLVTHAGIFGTLKRPAHAAWLRPPGPENQVVREAVTVSGSAYFVKRSVFNEMYECPIYRDLYPDVEGPFLPTKHYYEETWFSYHVQAHGYKVMYDGEVKMIHQWHTSTPKGGWADRQIGEAKKMFVEMCDHHGIDHD